MEKSVLRVGVLTVSDRAFQGVYEDRGGPAIQAWLQKVLLSAYEIETCVVPDDFSQITSALERLCDVAHCALVLTTGGTGPAPRDVTPEATLAVCRRFLPGFGEKMRADSLKKTPTAILSRQIAGIRGSSLIVNLPGNPKAVSECLEAVFPAIPDCLYLMDAAADIQVNPAVLQAPMPHAPH